MTEIHKIVCERCGKEKSLENDRVFQEEKYKKPSKWEEIDAHHAGVVSDLCRECFKDYMAVQEYFFNEKLRNRVDLEDEDLQVRIKEAK